LKKLQRFSEADIPFLETTPLLDTICLACSLDRKVMVETIVRGFIEKEKYY